MHFLNLYSLFLGTLIPAILAAPSPRCETNIITSKDVIKGSVPINASPLLPFQSAALTQLNTTAWEYWYFDGVSHSTSAGVTIAFFRDPSLMAGGLGPLRMGVDAVWENGTWFSAMILADDSTIETCDDGTTIGRWKGPQTNSSFEFKEGNAEVKINLDGISITGDKVKGLFTLKSISNPRYPTGETFPNAKASPFMAPLLLWNEGIPAGDVNADLSFNGAKLAFKGIGGTDRNVAPYIWDFIADRWWWVRSVAGPYSFVLWKFVSAVDGKTYVWSYLEEYRRPIFRSSNECTRETDSGCAVLTLTEGGKIKGGFRDPSSGFKVELREKWKGRKWVFDIEHVNIVFEAPQGRNNEYTRFVNSVKGGEVGCKQYEGPSKSEQNRITEVIPMI
ncbi:hypothetical protein GQ43DRAFT_386588 [Delitschia confertaspora ATCC 74209]|uniref:Hydroxyneurosporene synthase (CrtC) n=1 Tax=Delitschia confertaspora ATCC 74209 TaxID=1513339 RepID=A0A9P4N2T4_9PLEO|nr:hypothetical protein GQ43DRAFT_386588 [Delitschia confertaspora ATCC 74209]